MLNLAQLNDLKLIPNGDYNYAIIHHVFFSLHLSTVAIWMGIYQLLLFIQPAEPMIYIKSASFMNTNRYFFSELHAKLKHWLCWNVTSREKRRKQLSTFLSVAGDCLVFVCNLNRFTCVCKSIILKHIFYTAFVGVMMPYKQWRKECVNRWADKERNDDSEMNNLYSPLKCNGDIDGRSISLMLCNVRIRVNLRVFWLISTINP